MPTSPVYNLKIECTNYPALYGSHHESNTGICREKKGVYNTAQEKTQVLTSKKGSPFITKLPS